MGVGFECQPFSALSSTRRGFLDSRGSRFPSTHEVRRSGTRGFTLRRIERLAAALALPCGLKLSVHRPAPPCAAPAFTGSIAVMSRSLLQPRKTQKHQTHTPQIQIHNSRGLRTYCKDACPGTTRGSQAQLLHRNRARPRPRDSLCTFCVFCSCTCLHAPGRFS